MGQKVHPYILRIGFGKEWQSRWFCDKKRDYAQYLDEDLKIRTLIGSSYTLGSIASIVIERVSTVLIRVRIRTSRPGVIIDHEKDLRAYLRETEIESDNPFSQVNYKMI